MPCANQRNSSSLGTIRWERRPQLTRSWPWNANGRLHATRTAQKCVQLTLPMPSAHCTETERERVLGALATEAPFLLPHVASAWHETGSALWTRGPNGWHQHATRRRVPQGSLSAILFALAFGIAVREATNLAYADDPTVWEGKSGALSKSRDGLTTALKAGLEMKPTKCTAWRRHNPANSEPVIPGTKSTLD